MLIIDVCSGESIDKVFKCYKCKLINICVICEVCNCCEFIKFFVKCCKEILKVIYCENKMCDIEMNG